MSLLQQSRMQLYTGLNGVTTKAVTTTTFPTPLLGARIGQPFLQVGWNQPNIGQVATGPARPVL